MQAAIDPDVIVRPEGGLSSLMAAGETPVVEREQTAKRVRSVTIVVPAKNESETIDTVVAAAFRQLESLELQSYEIVVVDDGSDDETGARASEVGARVVRHHHSLGNGAAVKRGIREARCEWILLLDADGQHPPEKIPDLVRRAEEHDMVVASRGGHGGAWHRNLANQVYSRFASYVTSSHIPDLTSGFRLVRADVAKRLVYLLPNTFSYPTTITLSMMRCGYSVGFEPFAVRKREGKSHIRLLSDGSRFFMIILKVATFFAPLRVFMPLSAMMFMLGVGWYAYTFITAGRFTNMSALLMSQATILFTLGLVSEQVAALRFSNVEEPAQS